jgi:pimeloyl-ACP methyl ester carboxylesterase
VASWLLRPGRGIVLNFERSAWQGRHPVEHYPMPVLVLRGQHQNPGLHTVHGRITARSARGQTVVIDQARHLCHLERPEQTNAAIRAFRSP